MRIRHSCFAFALVLQLWESGCTSSDAPDDAATPTASDAGTKPSGADSQVAPVRRDSGAGLAADGGPDIDAALDAAPDAGGPLAAPCQPFVMPSACSVPDGGVLPGELSCTGLYSDFAQRSIACGVEPYKPAFELWSDGAEKHRFMALPPGTQIDVSDPDNFKFPVGTRVWKEFRIQVGGASKLAETRLLHKSTDGWLYTTYVWSEDGATAVQQNDGVPNLFGSVHTVPTRDQCHDCHVGRPDFVLGWDMLMLGEGASGLTRQVLSDRGLLRGADGGLPSAEALSAKVPGNDVEHAALGYLHANCGISCHNDSALAPARETGLLARLDLDTLGSAQSVDVVTTGINRVPGLNAKFPAGGPYFDIRPGDAAHSLLLARMRVRGETQMPRFGTNVVDTQGSLVVERWIESLTAGNGYAPPAPLDEAAPGAEATPPAGADAGISAPDAGGTAPPTQAPGCDANAVPSTGGLGYQVVVASPRLETLTFAAQPPDSDDWYLVEMIGRITRLHNGVLDPVPFLDLTSAIALGAGFDQTTITYDERGLVGLAFAPDFASSGLFYVTITPSNPNGLGLAVDHDMVLEFRRGAPGTSPVLERKLLEVPSALAFLGNIHNANTVRFGPDGLLYVGMGDGGGVSCNDAQPNAAQDVAQPFGKILRLDPRRPAPYGAADNPFVGMGDARVLHYGLRNPFRFSFDRQTGDLLIGDVGQDHFEELDFAPSGARGLNFGWATYEANAACPGPSRPLRPGSVATPPIFVADRLGTGPFRDYRAITGGVVYRGAGIPSLQGAYLFGDYYGARLGALYPCASSAAKVSTLRKSCDANFPEPCLPTPSGAAPFSSLTAIVEDHAGEIYFVASGNSLLKLVPRP
ncbi:MAG: hypothetical protein JWN48_2621 [Myxococcaceae bacterium]|nr:hypothetical protein [Myxococcaceae bacterium]